VDVSWLDEGSWSAHSRVEESNLRGRGGKEWWM